MKKQLEWILGLMGKWSGGGGGVFPTRIAQIYESTVRL